MEWIKSTTYHIYGGYIQSADDVIFTYSPFQYYENPIPEDMVQEILDESKKEVKPFYIHTLFLSLNKPEELCNFANYFGLPFYRSKEIKVDEEETITTKDLNNPIPTQEIFEEINALRLLLYFFHAAEDEDIEQLRVLFKEVTRNKVITLKVDYIPEWQVYDDEDIILSAKNLITDAFNATLSNVSPILIYNEDTPPTFDWQIPNLLNAIYLMLSFDMINQKTPLFCENKLCNNIFNPGKGVTRYCSLTCQSRVKTRRYKQKKKKEKEE